MKLETLKQNASNIILKVQVAAMVTCGAIMSSMQSVMCDDSWESLADSSGAENVFTMIGRIYAKWAWLPGIIFGIWWAIRRGEKDGEVARTTTIGILIGYAAFAIGAAVWVSFFQSVGDGFGTGLQ